MQRDRKKTVEIAKCLKYISASFLFHPFQFVGLSASSKLEINPLQIFSVAEYV